MLTVMKKEADTTTGLEGFEQEFKELCGVIASLDTREDAERFLWELCTGSELLAFAKRWALMKELLAGTPQRTIARKFQMSLCKITRGARYSKTENSLLRARAAEALARRGTSSVPPPAASGPS